MQGLDISFMKKFLSVSLFLINQIGFSQVDLRKFITNYIDTSTDFRNQVIDFFYTGKKPKNDIELYSFSKKDVSVDYKRGLNIKTDIIDSVKLIIKSSSKKDYIICKYSTINDSTGECEVYVINKRTIVGYPFLYCNFLVQFFSIPKRTPKIEYIKKLVM